MFIYTFPGTNKLLIFLQSFLSQLKGLFSGLHFSVFESNHIFMMLFQAEAGNYGCFAIMKIICLRSVLIVMFFYKKLLPSRQLHVQS